MKNKPVALVILDNFGISQNRVGNALTHANMPYLSSWINTMPHTQLHASGKSVGLPQQYDGSSEIGHVTIGSGRITQQIVTTINIAIANGSFFENSILKKLLTECAKKHKPLHVIGILADAGAYGNQDHITAYMQAAYQQGIKKIYIHAILDGKDISLHTAYSHIEELKTTMSLYNAHLGSVHGGFYAMDGSKNYDHTKQSYRVMTNVNELLVTDLQQYILNTQPSAEYCEPIRVEKDSIISDNDFIIFTACRADKIQQLVRAFNEDHTILGSLPVTKNLTLVSPTFYGTNIKTQPLFEQDFCEPYESLDFY